MQKSYQYTPSTAYKRNSNQNSHYKASYQNSPTSNQNRRNQTNISSKIQGLKKSIDIIIGQFRQKSNLQKNAIQRVQNVNYDLKKQCEYEQKNPIMTQSYRTSGFKVNNLSNDVKSQFIYPTYFPQKQKMHQQNVKLQEKLNRQMKSNNNLLKEVDQLFRHKQNSKKDLTGRFSSNIWDEQQQLIQQNRKLKWELSKIKSNTNYQSITVEEFMSQFQKLKEQNQRLRQQTVQVFRY